MDNSDRYLEVLLTEYQAIKNDQKSRTTLQVQLIGFVFLAASIGAALLEPVITRPNNEILLLAISIGFSLIGFLYLSISKFIQDLIQYENDVLIPKIQRYLDAVHSTKDPDFEKVLTWWPWYRIRLQQEGTITKLVKASTLYTPLVFSLGLVIFFVYFLTIRGRVLLQMSSIEAVFLVIAVLMIIIYFLSIIRALRTYSFFEVTPGKPLVETGDRQRRQTH